MVGVIREQRHKPSQTNQGRRRQALQQADLVTRKHCLGLELCVVRRQRRDQVAEDDLATDLEKPGQDAAGAGCRNTLRRCELSCSIEFGAPCAAM
jgi:hypothetical protein